MSRIDKEINILKCLDDQHYDNKVERMQRF